MGTITQSRRRVPRLLTAPIEATCVAHRTVLLEQYETAQKQYAKVVDELDKKVALLPNSEYSKLCLDAEKARVEYKRLRETLRSEDVCSSAGALAGTGTDSRN